MLMLAAEKDVLCTPAILEDAARRYQHSYQELVRSKKVDGFVTGEVGVRFAIVSGLGHLLQNELEWEKGVQEIYSWVEQL